MVGKFKDRNGVDIVSGAIVMVLVGHEFLEAIVTRITDRSIHYVGVNRVGYKIGTTGCTPDILVFKSMSHLATVSHFEQVHRLYEVKRKLENEGRITKRT